MNPHTLQHILRRAARSLWENLYLNAVATGVVAASVLLLGVYASVQHNLDHIVETWSRDVHISAYFAPGVPESERFALRDQLAARPEVAAVRYISEADAEGWLVSQVAGLEPVLAELGEGVLPASLEITLTSAASQPAAMDAFVAQLQSPVLDDIDYGREWVERFNAFLALLRALGAFLGLLILLSGAFLVTNTIHLVVYSRRDELEVARLVGASPSFIILPFVLEGLVQGILGFCVALGGLWLVHRIVVLRLQEALQLDVGGDLQLMPLPSLALLGLAALSLGVFAALVATRRFLARAP